MLLFFAGTGGTTPGGTVYVYVGSVAKAVKANTEPKVARSQQSRIINRNSGTNRIATFTQEIRTTDVLFNPSVVNTKMMETALDTTRFVFHETPTPATNGSQVIFTVANAYQSGLLEVFVDGLLQTKTTDYTETSNTTFTFVTAPLSTETVKVNYIKA
jgi:hypothetical protein